MGEPHESKRQLPRPRPRFELESKLSREEIVSRLKAFLVSEERIRGIVLLHRLELAHTRSEQHLWSPQLIVDVESTPTGSRLKARFGPHPHVWGMYMMIVGVLSILTLIALSYGFSQWLIGEKPTALYVVPVVFLITGLAYGASFVGQGLGFEQMYHLRHVLSEVTEAEEISS